MSLPVPGRLLRSLFLLCAMIPAMATDKPPNDHRPQFHYSPASGWMNDPNGLVYADGTWHLFYQYFPGSTAWGPMHWGHATSRDLLHWEEQAVALAPDSRGYIFSGSAVHDGRNSSGLGTAAAPPLVALFSYHDMAAEKAGLNTVESQALAFSTDGGRRWTKYAGNPVIANTAAERHFRDPKVFWYQPAGRWYSVLAVGGSVRFYSSANLIDWTPTGEFGAQDGSHEGVWECPDLFALRSPGESAERWVLLVSVDKGAPNGGSGTQYFIGRFDGHTFINDNPARTTLWLDYGRDNYASVTWSDAPEGRRVGLGWMSNWEYARDVPTAAWRGVLTLPREFSLRGTPSGARLIQTPIPELLRLRSTTLLDRTGFKLRGSMSLPASGSLHELVLDIDLAASNADELGIELRNSQGESFRVGFDRPHRRYYADRRAAGTRTFSDRFASAVHYAARESDDHVLQMRVYFDRSSVELFGDRGATVLTDLYFPTTDFDRYALYAHGGSVEITGLQLFALRSTLTTR